MLPASAGCPGGFFIVILCGRIIRGYAVLPGVDIRVMPVAFSPSMKSYSPKPPYSMGSRRTGAAESSATPPTSNTLSEIGHACRACRAKDP
jgi:hypothetical protein